MYPTIHETVGHELLDAPTAATRSQEILGTEHYRC
jgi:hypothetical protein